MIRYSVTNSSLRIVRVRSAAASGIELRSKSTQAAHAVEEDDDNHEGPLIRHERQNPQHLSRKPQEGRQVITGDLHRVTTVARNADKSWRERLNHYHNDQKSKRSSWRDTKQTDTSSQPSQNTALTDFFNKRRQAPRPPPPAIGRGGSSRLPGGRPAMPRTNMNVGSPMRKERPTLPQTTIDATRGSPMTKGHLDFPKTDINNTRGPPRFHKPSGNFNNAINSRPKPYRSTWRNRVSQLSPKQQGPTSPSARKPAPLEDMKDVSELREAYEKFKTPLPDPPSPSVQKASWRRGGGAKDFRKAQALRKQQHKERHDRYHRTQQAAKTFFQTGYERQEQLADEEKDLQVLLPRSACSVPMFSSVLQVNKQAVLDVLEDMGERNSSTETYEMDVDTMELVALELGYEPIRDQRKGAFRVEDDVNRLLQRRAAGTEETQEAAANVYESFPPRPPVVACMGHVDHGKTTLTDALRRQSQPVQASSGKKTKKKKKGANKATTQHKGDVAGTEAGGITQVISAFQIELESKGAAVTFLDTPGHAAFKSMRESGSHAADVIVLVVAADDGVSPQTVEILDFYKSIVEEAGSGAISLVVAMTKIDKPGVDVEESKIRITNQLLEHGIVTEDLASPESENQYGPPVQLIPVSGLTGVGLDDLIEGLVLQSEVMDLRADHDARAEGIVMDARIEKGLGVVADCIVRWGSLERGNVVVSGVHSGKVKVLKDVYGKTLNQATPSQPVRIIGFETLPKAGDPVICVSSEEKAKRLVEKREEHSATDASASSFRTDNDADPQFQVMGTASKTTHMTAMAENKYDIGDAENKTIRIPVLIKADADGTLAAVRDSLLEVGSMSSNYDIVVDPVGMGIGPILTSDVALAQQSGAAIFSFGLDNLNDKSTIQFAESDGVVVRSHNIIYSLLDDAKDVFAQHLPPAPVEVVHGSAKVQAVFHINNKRNAEVIAGLNVIDGNLYKDKMIRDKASRASLDCHYRVLRNGERVSPPGETTRASSLKRVKEDVEDVRRGDECGLGLDGFDDFQEGDVIECYSIEMQRVFV